ncbi:MAG: bifunctional demethylmenaquinone methyltransferase/2-methoxy-6-polyprenyl-1,4-benzoquinol methylase UbiE [Zavarzinella sp.]
MSELLDRREVRIQRMFDEIAPTYDFLNHLLSAHVDKLWRKRVTKLVPLTHGRMLDLCTGTGDLAFAYHQRTQGQFPVIGGDFSAEMLGLAVKKAKKLGYPIPFVQCDAQHLPFEDNSFDLVSISFGLRNVTNFRQGLSEMLRVLKPGGKLAVLEFSKPKHWLMGRAYRAYFKFVLPTLGQLVSRSKDRAYVYLPASTMEFPDGEELATIMRETGFDQVNFRPFTLGIATLYIGTKPETATFQ